MISNRVLILSMLFMMHVNTYLFAAAATNDSTSVTPPAGLQQKCSKVINQGTTLNPANQTVNYTVTNQINPATCRWVNAGSWWALAAANIDSTAACNTFAGEVAVAVNWQMKGAFGLGGSTNIGVYCCQATTQVTSVMSQSFQNCP